MFVVASNPPNTACDSHCEGSGRRQQASLFSGTLGGSLLHICSFSGGIMIISAVKTP